MGKLDDPCPEKPGSDHHYHVPTQHIPMGPVVLGGPTPCRMIYAPMKVCCYCGRVVAMVPQKDKSCGPFVEQQHEQ